VAVSDLNDLDDMPQNVEEQERVHSYVAGQLQWMRSRASIGPYEDEFETQLDNQPNGS
jgi:hypothetical protein